MKLILQLPGLNSLPAQLHELLSLSGYKLVCAESLLEGADPDIVLLDREAWLDLSYRSSYDFLTETLNRATFTMKARGEVQKAHKNNDTVSCILLDIDYFKAVNDTYGHTIGDSTLKAVSQLLKLHCRDSDLLGRYGGEEFVTLFPNTGILDAEQIANRLREVIEHTPILTSKGPVSVTVSIGIANLQLNETLESLVDRADQALCLAKSQGRNQVRVHGDC